MGLGQAALVWGYGGMVYLIAGAYNIGPQGHTCS
jgi:hypothetical protein